MRYADRPVPIVELPPTTMDYHAMPIDETDPRGAEPLVLLRDYGLAGDNYYCREAGNPPYDGPIEGAIERLLSRKGVADRLVSVNDRLRAIDLELYILDAYRPIECQRGIWDFFWRRFSRELPRCPARALQEIVGRYVSDPRRFDVGDPSTWPVHITGGAVDLTMRRRSTGLIVDMGTHIDDAGARSHTDFFERRQLAGNAEEAAPLTYRRVLYWHMVEAGFTNYPYEYWHYDYGDQMHALLQARGHAARAPTAFYGFIALSGAC